MISYKYRLLSIFCIVQTSVFFVFYRNCQIANVIESDRKLNRTSFFNIGMKFKTDKVYLHHYERFYEKYLSHYRDTPVRLLEIGLGCDMIQAIGASARTWREYLGDQAEIHILEIDTKCGEKWFSTIGKQVNDLRSMFKFNVDSLD